MRTVAICQARMGSSRLPGKVLADIAGYPMLWHVVTRVSRAHLVDDVVLATTTRPEDDAIVAFCHAHSIPCFRGSGDDVLDRYLQCATTYRADLVVRVTGDCPLIDPLVIDAVVHAGRNAQVDYCANAIVPTWPDGQDVEVIWFGALERAWHGANLPSEREHVGPYLRNHPERFWLLNVAHDPDLSGEKWSVDNERDLAFVRAVFAELGEAFGMADVLALLEHQPELRAINAGQERDGAYKWQVAKELSRRRDK